MDKITEISERVAQLIEYWGVNKNDFAKKLGYKRAQTVYDIVNGKAKPSFDFFNRLYNTEYSENINPFWIFTGKGEMIKIENGNGNDSSKDDYIIELQRDKIKHLEKELAQAKKDHKPLSGYQNVAEPDG